MYCKHCGKEISEDSVFCKYCGEKQDENTNTVSDSVDSKSEITKKPEVIISIPKIKSELTENQKWWILGISLWVLFHIYCLFGDDHPSYAPDYFFPFYGGDSLSYDYGRLYYYDFTEFLFYVFVLPLLLWGGKMLYKKFSEDDKVNEPKNHDEQSEC